MGFRPVDKSTLYNVPLMPSQPGYNQPSTGIASETKICPSSVKLMHVSPSFVTLKSPIQDQIRDPRWKNKNLTHDDERCLRKMRMTESLDKCNWYAIRDEIYKNGVASVSSAINNYPNQDNKQSLPHSQCDPRTSADKRCHGCDHHLQAVMDWPQEMIPVSSIQTPSPHFGKPQK